MSTVNLQRSKTRCVDNWLLSTRKGTGAALPELPDTSFLEQVSLTHRGLCDVFEGFPRFG